MTYSKRFATFAAAAVLGILVGCAGAGTKTGVAVDDAAITTKVKSQMATDKEVSATSVSVNTDNGGVVTLTGIVKSEAEKRRAGEIARSVNGVKSVNNQLVVKPQ